MILYKPTNQLFLNRLEAKLKIGHSRFNKIMKYSPDDLVFINKKSLATDERLYSNTQLDKTEHVPPLKTVKSVQFWS